MTSKSNILTAALVFFSLGATAQEALTLEGAINQALGHNHDLYIAAQEAQQSQNSATVGNAGLLPTVTATAGVNYSIQNSDFEFTTGQSQQVDNAESLSQNAAVNLNQTVFAGGARWNNYALLKQMESMATLQERQQMEITVAQTISQYYALVLMQEQLENLEHSMEISLDRFTRAKKAKALGVTSTLDLMRAEVDLNQDSITLLEMQVAVDNAWNTFTTYTGVPKGTVLISDVELKEGLVLTEIQAKALQYNTALQLAGIGEKSAHYQQRIQQAQQLPMIATTATYSYSTSEAEAGMLSSSSTDGLSAGLSMQWNLFGGGATRTAVQNAKIAVDINERRAEKVEDEISNSVVNAYAVWQNALTTVRMEQKNAVLATLNYEKTQELYKMGSASYTDLRLAQLAMISATSSALQANFTAKNAEVMLYQLSGQLLTAYAVNQ